MRRILVDPSALEQTATAFDQVAAGLEALSRRAAQSPAETDWASRSIGVVEGRMADAGRLGADLAAEAFGMGQELRQAAERFLAANAWRPGWGTAAAAGATATATAGAPVPGAKAEPVIAPDQDAAGAPLAALYARFPGREAILAHIVNAEGMRAPNVAHGGVVYYDEGGLRSDGQWLNFGYISFAMPSGTGGAVLRRIFNSPEEVETFRAIALEHLQEQPPSSIPASHTHLLRGATPAIAPLTAAEQAEQFVALVQAGDDAALADWFFKYGNEPAVEQSIATGHLRPEWRAVMQEFLVRPASVEAQLTVIDQNYLSRASASAEAFGLQSEKALAWFTDQHVQSGSPKERMWQMLAPEAPSNPQLQPLWQRYQSGTEAERLQVLTELSGDPGTTVRRRRESVLANEALSWAPFKP